MTLFSRIINGEIHCYKIAENEHFFAFLDINPLVIGHTLVIPKQEIDYIYDLEDHTLGDIFIFTKKIAIAIKKAIPCVKVGVAVIGLEVPHVHIHLVPMHSVLDINFTKPKLNPTDFELEEARLKIIANL